MKLTTAEISKMIFEPTVLVTMRIPRGLLSRIDARAASQLTSRSAWLKQLAVNALRTTDD